MSRTPSSRAALILALEGVRGRDLAERLRMTPQAVSWHLAGRSAETPRELLDAVADLAGVDTALKVSHAIAQARHGRSE